jgi:hypothetical protein
MNIRIIAIAPVLLSIGVGLAVAQAVTGQGKTTQGKPQAYAAVVQEPHSALQQMIWRKLVADQEVAFDQIGEFGSSPEGDAARTQIILVNNYYLRGLLTPEQQVAHDRSFLGLGAADKGGKWKRVLTSGTIVKTLIRGTPEQELKLSDIDEQARKRIVSESLKINPTRNQPNPEQRIQHRTMWRSIGAQCFEAQRQVLTDAQRQELDALLAAYQAELKTIVDSYRRARGSS